jgi:hypothetical protein
MFVDTPAHVTALMPHLRDYMQYYRDAVLQSPVCLKTLNYRLIGVDAPGAQ